MTRSKPPITRPDTVGPSDAVHDAQRGAAESNRGSGRIVNRYQTGLPGVACGIAAVAMAAMTFGLLVVAPATIGPGSESIGSPRTPQPLAEIVPAATRQAAAEISPAAGCDKAIRSRLPETHCAQDPAANQPTTSDASGAGCLGVS